MFEDEFNESDSGSEIDELITEEVEVDNEKDSQIVNPEEVQNSEILCFENLILSSSNTVKLIDKAIVMDDIKILKDAPGVNIFIFIDDDIKEIDKQCCDMMNDDDKDVNLYSIMFINENLAKEITDKYNIEVTSQNVLRKEGIEDEASAILSGQDD